MFGPGTGASHDLIFRRSGPLPWRPIRSPSHPGLAPHRPGPRPLRSCRHGARLCPLSPGPGDTVRSGHCRLRGRAGQADQGQGRSCRDGCRGPARRPASGRRGRGGVDRVPRPRPPRVSWSCPTGSRHLSIRRRGLPAPGRTSATRSPRRSRNSSPSAARPRSHGRARPLRYPTTPSSVYNFG